MRWTKDAHQMRISSYDHVEVGLSEPEHFALALPIGWQVIGPREKLPVEVRGLSTIKDAHPYTLFGPAPDVVVEGLLRAIDVPATVAPATTALQGVDDA